MLPLQWLSAENVACPLDLRFSGVEVAGPHERVSAPCSTPAWDDEAFPVRKETVAFTLPEPPPDISDGQAIVESGSSGVC